MKKFLLTIVAALGICAYAEVTQYPLVPTAVTPLEGQSWDSAAQYMIHVTGNGSLWIRNDINTWYGENFDLGAHELNMIAGNYGTVDANSNLVASKDITKDFFYSLNSNVTVSTKGYWITDFTGEQDIYFWITSKSGQIGSSQGPVYDAYGSETAQGVEIASRQFDSGIDLPTGVERLNFGFKDNSVSEFIFIGENTYYNSDIGGTPLPGTMASLVVLGLGALGLKKSKKSKKA